jgi:hypothetical protein
MNRSSFGWVGSGLLRDELCRPIERISALFVHPVWRGASAVTLWRRDGSGLRIFTEMFDVAPKLEVGVLNFETVVSPAPGEQFVDLNSRFRDDLKVSKLCITESGISAESGIVIKGKDEIAIVAGGFPLTLALRGVEFDSPASAPEYPWEEYQLSEL